MKNAGALDEVSSSLRALFTDAEKLIGAMAAGHSAKRLNSLRARLDASQRRIARQYSRAKKNMHVLSLPRGTPVSTELYEILSLALGIGTLVAALVDRQRR